MSNKKILGIDYGDYTIGLAIFNVDKDFIYPYKTIYRKKANVLRKSLREIIDLIRIENIIEIVIGYPLNFDGTEGERVEKVKVFAKMLENKLKDSKIDVSVSFQDERLTTVEARELLSTRGIKKEDEKFYIDQVAAEIILSDYRQGEHA